MFRGILFLTLILLVFKCSNGQYNVMDYSDCVLPFEYNGKTYTNCTSIDRKYHWCSLTKSFEGAWKYCIDMTQSKWTCTGSCSDDQYPSCQTKEGRRIYCIDKILDTSAKPVSSCPSEYRKLNEFHTACLPKVVYVAKSGVSREEIKEIVDLHNEWRSRVAVPAAAMQKMYWDDDLAMVAQKHADRCSFYHDSLKMRAMPDTGRSTGQNIVSITGTKNHTWAFAFNEMFAGESKRWEYRTGIKKQFNGMHAYHYTQILLEQLSKVGCGYSECAFVDRIEKFYVCNYNYMQKTEETKVPYREGEFCSLCPTACDNKLCDCGGKECYNDGFLDVESCTCKCQGLWKGERCDIPIIPERNSIGCMIPFVMHDKLHYDCVDDGEGPICSKTAIYNGDHEYCDEGHMKRSREFKVPSRSRDFFNLLKRYLSSKNY